LAAPLKFQVLKVSRDDSKSCRRASKSHRIEAALPFHISSASCQTVLVTETQNFTVPPSEGKIVVSVNYNSSPYAGTQSFSKFYLSQEQMDAFEKDEAGCVLDAPEKPDRWI
jgi:hypothetical protein